MAKIGDLIKKTQQDADKQKAYLNSAYSGKGDAARNGTPTTAVVPAQPDTSSKRWVSTGAGRKSTVGDLDAALARLEEARKKAAYIDNDDAAVLDINRQMKELRAQFGQQTAGDRAWDISSAIVNPVLGQTVNVAGVVANTVDNVDRHKRDLERMKAVLAAGKTTDGKTLTAEQRKGVENRIKELEEQIRQEEAGETVHGKIYKWADERAEMGAKAQESAKLGLGTTGQTLVDAGVAFGQSALAGAVGGATGTGMLPFAIQAFGGATQDARQSGATLNQQIVYGAAQAGKEYLTEKLFGLALPQKLAGSTGSFDDVTEKAIRKAVEKFAKTEAGQRVLGGVGTWLMGGVTEGLEELIGAGIENVVINPALRGFDPDTRTSEEKWEEAWYSAIVGGLSGLFGVTNLVGYQPSAKSTKTAAVTSPAAAPEVQQLSEQAEVTQELNPDSKVLDAATTLFMNEQGCNQKTAEFRASVVQKLVAGEEVDTKTLKRIDPTNKTTQRIFTQLTGVQFPTGPADMAAVLPIFRTAHQVAVQMEAQAKLQQEAVDNAQPVADNIIEQPAQREQVTGEPTIEEFAAKYRAIRPDATDTEIQAEYNAFRADYEAAMSNISLPSGKTITKEQFKTYMTKRNQLAGREVNDEVLERQFDYLRANIGVANVAATLETIAEDVKEASANAGEGVSAGDGVRRSGQSEGERSGAVPEAGRRAETEDRERGSTRDSATDSRGGSGQPEASARDARKTREQEVKALRARKPKVRTAKVDGESISVLHVKELDEGCQRVRGKFAKIGSQVHFTMGNLPVVVNGKKVKGKRAAGIHFRNVTYVQMDNTVRTGEQLGNHEFIHELLMKFPQLREKMLEAFYALPEDVQDALYTGYEGVYKTTLEGKSPEVVDRTIMDEIFCDAYGNINRSGLNASVLHDQIAEIADTSVDDYVKQQEERHAREVALAEQQDKVDKERSEEIAKQSREFALTEAMFWDEQLANLDEVKKNGNLYIRETPNIVAEVGLGDLPMCMTVDHLLNDMHPKDPSNPHWHGVPEGIMLQLPELLSRPAMILKSRTNKGDILVVTTAYDLDKLPVVAAIRPNGTATVDGVIGPANFITSVYGRNNFAPVPGEMSKNNLLYLSLRDRGILYWHRERTERLLSRCGLKLPYTVTKIQSETILGHRDYYRPGQPTPERRFALDEEITPEEKLKDSLAEMGMYGAYNDWFTFKKGLEHVGDKAVLKLDFFPKYQGSIEVLASAKMLAADGKFREFGTYEVNPSGFAKFMEEMPEFLDIALDNKMILEQEGTETYGYPYEEDEDGDPIFKLINADTGELYTDGYHFKTMAEDTAEDMWLDKKDVQIIKHPDGDLEAFVMEDGNKVKLILAKPNEAYYEELPTLDDDWLGDGPVGFDDMPDLPDFYPDDPFKEMPDPHYAPDLWLQNNRDGFTPTDTEDFKRWFNDDSGWLTLADGRPKVLARGTTLVGPTTGRLYSEAKSGGTFASDQESIAVSYGEGTTSSGYHIGEMIGLNRGKRGSTEVATGYKTSWSDMRDFINENYRTAGETRHGLNLIPKKGRRVTDTKKAKVFELWTDILPEDQRVGYDSKEHQVTSVPAKVTGDWRVLATYPNTDEGLDQLNRDIGKYIRELDIGIPGHYKFYGSAKKTLVINCEGYSYKSIPNELIPEWARSTRRPKWDTNSHINGICRRAFDRGYDCVVAAYIDDIGEIQNQYIFKDPNQIKSVYNKGTWDTEDMDRNFALSEEDTVLSDHGLRNNYSSWSELYQSIAFSSGIRHNLAMEMMLPAPPWDVNTIGAVGMDGEWLETLGEYSADADGLKKLNADLHNLVLRAEEIADADADFTGVSEKEDLGAIEDEDIALNSSLLTMALGLSTAEKAKRKTYTDTLDDDLQNNREEFTPTNTKAFKRWHKDPSGELTLPDGRPMVFISGDSLAGYTRGRRYGDTNSPGLWHTRQHKVAFEYAKGVTSRFDFTPMDSLRVNKERGTAVPELKHKVLGAWDEAVEFINNTYRNEDNQGVRLVPVRNGKLATHQTADEYILQTNILPPDLWWGLDAQGRLNYDEADSIFDTEVISNAWQSIAKYPATDKGLHKMNRELGDQIVKVNAGIRAFSKYYISMANPLIINCRDQSCHHLTNDVLPEWAHTEEGFMGENDFVRLAFSRPEGYDGVILKNILDEGGIQDQYCVKNPWQRKSVYNRGTWSNRDYDTRYALDEQQQSNLDDLLARIDKEYAEGTAQKVVAAFNARQASVLAAKRMAEAQPSVGAADLGFDPYTNLANTYGTVEPGENPDKVIDMPAQTKPNNKVSLTPRTVMEAKATPESRIPTIEDAVVDHKFSYIEGHNKIQVRRAVAKLKKEGWAETLTNWTRDVRDGKVNADLVVMGAVMLNNAGNSDMSGARYTQLLVDYTDLLRSAGQATQAARVLKNLTPEARLYGLYGYANRMNDRIRKDDPAHNIPVEKWMEVTGELLAKRLQQSVGGNRSRARTTAQIILKDLNSFAREAFPEKEKSPSRTEMDRLQDLFDNYDNYREAWEAAKDTIRNEYADKPEAMAAFEKFLETDLSEAFLGRYFNAPEVRVRESLAQEFLNAKTEEERNAVIDRIIEDIARQIPATKMEKFTALRYLNMLGNFKTQGRNLLGNSFNLALTGMKNQVAALLEWAVNLNGEKVERTKSFTKDKATYQAALKDFEKMKEIILSGGKYQDGRRFDERIEEKRTIFKNKALEGYRKATNWAMTQGDLVFSRIAYADALAGYLAAHGKTFETAGDTLMEQARNYAVRQAAEATFRDSNMFSEAIAGMRFRNPDTIVKRGINAIGEGVLPFRKTPANILVRAVEYSPVGVLTTVAEAMYGKNKTGAVDGSKVIDSLAKNITGTGLMVLGYALANSGLLHGAAPDDDKEKEFEDLTGHQAYSIELPNGLSLTLDWLAPSSIPLFLGAQIAETAAEDGMAVRTALDAIGSITDPMLQMSMLQGLDDALANASTYGDDSALVRFTGNALWSFMTQGLTNTMLGQLERSLKNERSTTYRDKNKDLPDGLQYLVGKTLEKTPFVDYNQIPYIDAWGRIETNAKTDFGNVFTQFFSPSYVSWVNESDMEEELQRLHDATGEGSVLISRPKSYFNVGKERKDLTAEEYIEYATTRGQLAYNVATDLTESKIYGTLTDKQKVAAVEKAYDFANQVAKATVTGYDPSKWDSDAPEGAAVPDKWVMDAMTDAAEYGIPAGEYAALYAATKDIESYKDKKGETVDNSKSLKLAVVIYDLGLSDAQTDKLMEDFGVNKTVRKYSEKMARRKLDAMKEKYE